MGVNLVMDAILKEDEDGDNVNYDTDGLATWETQRIWPYTNQLPYQIVEFLPCWTAKGNASERKSK